MKPWELITKLKMQISYIKCLIINRSMSTHKLQDEENLNGEANPEEKTSNEIYTYTAPWNVYAFNFSNHPNQNFRLAMGSFLEHPDNYLRIIQLHPEQNKFELIGEANHTYAPTKIMWVPDLQGTTEDLFATTSDCLRIWKCNGGIKNVANLVNTRNTQYSGPLTSFDWNPNNLSMVGTASIDNTCTIWDIESETMLKQILTHTKEVNDIAFGHDSSVFTSVSADGSVRMFDLRDLNQCTIMYENRDCTPIMRVSWNKIDPHFLAVISMESPLVTILDTRHPGVPIVQLSGHSQYANSIAWAPNSNCYICTAGDDCQALIWDLKQSTGQVNAPMMMYKAEAEIIMLNWSAVQQDWVAITYDKSLQLLKL